MISRDMTLTAEKAGLRNRLQSKQKLESREEINLVNKQDKAIVRELAARVAEIAALPVQDKKRALWRKLNALKPERPMVMIDQVCWHEMDRDGELTLRCTDPDCRGYELWLRRTLYQWQHFPVDMVVDPFVRVRKAINNTGFGLAIQEETSVSDANNDVVSHKYINQFQTEEDLEKIHVPQISHDTAETQRRLAVAHELFDGLLDVQLWGMEIFLSMWDPISTWMGVENALLAIVDRPDFIHRLMSRLTNGYSRLLDQLEEQGLLCGPQSLIHCTGAYSAELPAPGYNPERPRTKDIWGCGLAQMLSTVSPQMFKEFEVDYVSRLAARFGMVYYGCCDPLDGKMKEVRLIPGVRKVSMSPWVNEERGATEIGQSFVYSRKPNPAILAEDSFDSARAREELLKTRRICAQHGCPLELILKDISTVRYHPERLSQWAKIAMEVVQQS